MYELFDLISPKNIVLFILILSRLSGMMLYAPFFSTFPIPMQAKAVLIAMLSLIMLPIVSHSNGFVAPTNLIWLTLLIAKEIFIGLLIGFCSGLVFSAIQMSGHFLSIQTGLAVSNVLDPVTKNQSPAMGQFYLFLAGMAFLYINGHQWLFTSVFDSYNTIPVSLNFQLSGPMVDQIIYMTSQLFSISFGLIMPIYSVLFVADICLGFVSKMMPQMNIFMVALPFKIYLGLFLMILFMTPTSVYMTNLIRNFLQNILSIFT